VRVDGRRELIGIVWALSLALSPLHFHRYERYLFFNEIHMFVSANCNSNQHTRRQHETITIIRSSSSALRSQYQGLLKRRLFYQICACNLIVEH
jgi:hypothetical protein